MSRILLILSLTVCLGLMQSCLSPSKLYYFHDQEVTKHRLDTLDQTDKIVIHKGDRLHIVVSSPDPGITSYLNPYPTTGTAGVQSGTSGYLVDSLGEINFPQIGKLSLSGLTTIEASKLIEDKLLVYYKDIFVNVNINGRVFFLNGRNGTVIQMNNQRMTIFEAIAQSGVQDPYDLKNKVWLVREENGERSYAQLNLNKKEIFASPYYYLHNNDLIYVKPGILSSLLSPNSPARAILTFSGALVTLFLIIRR